MTPWTSSFLDVQYRARQFFCAYAEAYFAHCSTAQRLHFFENLAIERLRLEMSLAVYRVESRMGRTHGN